jgi:hypothetical protein
MIKATKAIVTFPQSEFRGKELQLVLDFSHDDMLKVTT